MEPICLEDVSSRLQAVMAPVGEYVVRAGEPGDAMYFINVGAVQVLVDGMPVDQLFVGGFFGEVALTAEVERSADVVSLGATSGVRCSAQGLPLGQRPADPAELFRLTRSDFEEVAERFPALEDRLHEVGMARVRRASISQCSPLRAMRRRSSIASRRGSLVIFGEGGEGMGRRGSLVLPLAGGVSPEDLGVVATRRRSVFLSGDGATCATCCKGSALSLGGCKSDFAGQCPPCTGPAAGSPSASQQQQRPSGAPKRRGKSCCSVVLD
jgi:CRP-like cAMP-binding protein